MAGAAPPAPSGAGAVASAEQLEELEALEAIFGEEYRCLSPDPPIRLCIKLRDPQAGGGMGGDEEDGQEAAGPPSRLFSLVFTLPQDYPVSSVPLIEVQGPLEKSSPLMLALQQQLGEWAAENLQLTGGTGCIYQVVEAAKERIDSTFPQDLGAPRRPMAAPLSDAVAEVEEPVDEDTPFFGISGAAALDLPAAPAPVPWWEAEEADAELMRRAIAEATVAHWSRWQLPSSFPAGTQAAPSGLDPGEEPAPPAAGTAVAGSLAVEDDVELAQKGRWDYCVGLVGKPSAGKSTFYNAVTDPASEAEGARVAAFPFTTITPNIGRGTFVVPDPAAALGLDPGVCRPAHGFAPGFSLERANPALNNILPLMRWTQAAHWASPGADQMWRRVPILIKDVAGLVPGAYQGRGRGNAFLNDLTDADVLVHVVDASGSTDREGQLLDEGEGADPVEDIGWVREELHRWVFDNVRSKWSGVRKKPSHLPDLFSGYHASRALVYQVLERQGLSYEALLVEGASLSHWGEYELHLLVATFLQARFPILLALNKADMASSLANIQRVREALPLEPAVAVSAATERWLCAQRRLGLISYEEGSGTCTPTAGCPQGEGGEGRGRAAEEKLQLATADSHQAGAGGCMGQVSAAQRTARQAETVQQRVLSVYGSTGVMLALATAVSLRPPRVVFPVGDVQTCGAIPARAAAGGGGGALGSGADAKVRAAEGSNASVLRDCVLLKPGSTTEDVFLTLRRPPYQLLEGDFVRADCRVLQPHPGNAAARQHGDVSAKLGGSSAAKAGSLWRVLRKDEVIDQSNSVCRIMTNKRGNWQRG